MASLASINIRFKAELTDFERDMKRVNKGLQGFGDKMQRAGKSMTTYLTGPIALFGGAALMAAGDFEAAMKNVEAITGATGGDLDALGEKAKELGKSTRFSASEAADAMAFLGMAGFDTKEIISAIPSVLELAAAASMDLAQAADIASNIMGQFGIAAEDTGRVTNLLAATASSANTNVEQLAEAMTYLGPTAQTLGVSVEDTAAMIGVLGDSGIQGSKAGRALATAMTNLAKPTAEMKTSLRAMNTEAFDSQGNFVGMRKLLAQVEAGTKSMTQEQKAANLATVFGTEALKHINVLLERGSSEYAKYADSITGTNKAADMAATKMTGWNAVLKEVRSAFEYLAIQIADSGLLQFATNMGKGLANLVRSFADLNPTIMKVVTVIAGLAAAAGPVLVALGFLSSTIIPMLITGFGALTTVMLANPFTAVAVAVAALVAGYMALNSVQEEAITAAGREQAELNGLVAAIQGAEEGSRIRAELMDELNKKYPDFLGNIADEKVGNEQLETALSNANREYEKRIILQSQEKKLQSLYETSARALQKQVNVRKDLSQALEDNLKKAGQAGNEELDLIERSRLARQQLASEITKAKFGTNVDTKALAAKRDLLDAIKEESDAISMADADYTAATNAVTEFKVQQIELMQAIDESAKSKMNDTQATEEDTEAKAEAAQSIAQLNDEIAKLKDQQENVTNREDWQALQAEIDNTQNLIDQIAGGTQVSKKTKSAVEDMLELRALENEILASISGLDNGPVMGPDVDSLAIPEMDFDGPDEELAAATSHLPKLDAVQRAMYQIAQGMERAGEEAALFGNASDVAAAKQEYLRQSIQALVAGGLSPQSDAIMELMAMYDQLGTKQNKIEQLRGTFEGLAGVMQQSLVGMFEGVENPFQMIIDYLKNLIIQLVAAAVAALALAVLMSALGFGGGIVANAASTFAGLSGIGISIPGHAEGAYTTGAHLAMVGEGSENEYILPESKLENALKRAAGGGMGGSLKVEGGEMRLQGNTLQTGIQVSEFRKNRWRK